ncbi:hypothetical protein MCOR25_002637 [Pyricularia grisea]|uniref:Signal recognition particle subunit SRP14 n=1 Tax=Pyricularia grisea TaxID=148305 RepID=A0A6P8BGN9_PYRGI|nr:uncharacterized protein PgNI_00445 [Pyricularia grisea]KAI6377140.1 hypothetical protein MCOR25_002637 [Pyricularia grisea]TLD15779.1 hypothetical protein PgNI_00445 [Pyricularia grisea]
MGRVTNEEFFIKLAELFAARKGDDHGQIHLTQKRLSHDIAPQSSDPDADLHPEKPLPIVVRASNGKGRGAKKEKLSLATTVDPEGLDAFYARYAEVCKAGMVALKPRDKSKKKAKAKKRKGGAVAGKP